MKKITSIVIVGPGMHDERVTVMPGWLPWLLEVVYGLCSIVV